MVKRIDVNLTLCELEILLLSIDRYEEKNRGDYFRSAKGKLLKASRELKAPEEKRSEEVRQGEFF